MTVTGKMYKKALTAFANGGINWTTDTIKVILLNSSFSPNQAHQYLSDIQANEITGTGYTAGGVTLAGKAVNETSDASYYYSNLDANDVVISNSTITCRNVAFYKSTGTASTSQLIGYAQSDTDINSSNGDWKITLNAVGLLQLSTPL